MLPITIDIKKIFIFFSEEKESKFLFFNMSCLTKDKEKGLFPYGIVLHQLLTFCKAKGIAKTLFLYSRSFDTFCYAKGQ